MKLLPALRAIVMASAFAMAAGVSAQQFGIDTLMQSLAKVRSGEATFTEERQVAQLDQALRSVGRLRFSAPDTFVRETTSPRHERLAVVGNELTIVQGGRTRTVMLDSIPEAAVMVEAIRGTLTGNRALLERYFATELRGRPESWELDLVPRDTRLRGQVARVRLLGRQGQVREVRIAMADGDSSVMWIEPVTAQGGGGAR
ncbi:MAG TPA: LolA-related protein [Ramlibacter sp.]